MATVSDFDDRERDDSGNGDDPRGANTNLPDRDPDEDQVAASIAGDSATGNPPTATNPRKRKKSSRASVSLIHITHLAHHLTAMFLTPPSML